LTESQGNIRGIGFTGWLTLLFIGLKLTGNISWPWVWVLAPAWIPLSILIAILVIIGLLKAILELIPKP
jgi:hypothetical protein